jgi:hypothetical protein
LISTVQELNYRLTVLISKKVFVNVADSFLLQIHNANTVITGSLVNIQGQGSNNSINNIYIRCTQHQPSNQIHEEVVNTPTFHSKDPKFTTRHREQSSSMRFS